MMHAWADYLDELRDAGKVIPLRRENALRERQFGVVALSPRKQGLESLGNANNINDLYFERLLVSRPCPVEILGSRARPR